MASRRQRPTVCYSSLSAHEDGVNTYNSRSPKGQISRILRLRLGNHVVPTASGLLRTVCACDGTPRSVLSGRPADGTPNWVLGWRGISRFLPPPAKTVIISLKAQTQLTVLTHFICYFSPLASSITSIRWVSSKSSAFASSSWLCMASSFASHAYFHAISSQIYRHH